MVSDFHKYRAQMFHTSGFSLMIPFGRLMLKLLDNEPININIQFLVVLFVSLLIGLCGIMLILKGLECVEARNTK